MADEEVFALVLGAGPVGMTATLDLIWRGVPTILLNDRLGTATHPKCNHTSGRSLEYFRRMGHMEAIRSLPTPGLVPREIEYVTRFCGYEIGRLPSQLPHRKDGKLVGGLQALQVTAEPGMILPQPMLEAGLKELVDAALGSNVRFGWRVTTIEERPDAVVVTARQVETGEERRIRARYVIACDGASSLARKSIGAVMTGDDGSEAGAFMAGSMLSYQVESLNLVELTGRPLAGLTTMISKDFRGMSFLQNDGTRWIFHYQVPKGVEAASLDAREVVRMMIGDDAVQFEIISGGPWTGGLAMVADRYQSGRIFLCGDAAHLYTPLGGTGMNTGIGDAMNITWKIAAVHDGWAGPALTDSFQAERRPIGLRNSRFGVDHTKVHAAWELPEDLEAESPEAEAHRREWGKMVMEADKVQFNAAGVLLGECYEGSPIIVDDGRPPPPDSLYVYTPSDHAGARMPHFWLDDGRALQDLLGKDYTLLKFAEADTASLEAVARAAGLPLKVVAAPSPPPEASITHALMLVRPDLHIGWSGDHLPSDIVGFVERIRGAAHAPVLAGEV